MKESSSVKFVKDSWIELKKVHKPTLAEVKQALFLVIGLVVVVASFLGFVDFIVGLLMKSLLT